MGDSTARTDQTSRAVLALSPWIEEQNAHSVLAINLGYNPISQIEVVSTLNTFNLTYLQYHFNYANCHQNYNPKVYLSAVQTTSSDWNYDIQTGQTNGLPSIVPGAQKSGSCTYINNFFFSFVFTYKTKCKCNTFKVIC